MGRDTLPRARWFTFSTCTSIGNTRKRRCLDPHLHFILRRGKKQNKQISKSFIFHSFSSLPWGMMMLGGGWWRVPYLQSMSYLSKWVSEPILVLVFTSPCPLSVEWSGWTNRENDEQGLCNTYWCGCCCCHFEGGEDVKLRWVSPLRSLFVPSFHWDARERER